MAGLTTIESLVLQLTSAFRLEFFIGTGGSWSQATDDKRAVPSAFCCGFNLQLHLSPPQSVLLKEKVPFLRFS